VEWAKIRLLSNENDVRVTFCFNQCLLLNLVVICSAFSWRKKENSKEKFKNALQG